MADLRDQCETEEPLESRGQTVYMNSDRAETEISDWISQLEHELLRARSARHAMAADKDRGRRHAIKNWKGATLALTKVRSVSAGFCAAVEASRGGKPLVVTVDHRKRNSALLMAAAFLGGLVATFAIGPYIMVGYENREAVRQELRMKIKSKRFEEVRDELRDLREDLELAEGDIRTRMVDIRAVLEPYRVMTEAIRDDLHTSHDRNIQINNEPNGAG